MTTKSQLTRTLAVHGYYPSARYAAKQAASEIGVCYMGGDLVMTDECICRVVITRKHECYAVEAECPDF